MSSRQKSASVTLSHEARSFRVCLWEFSSLRVFYQALIIVNNIFNLFVALTACGSLAGSMIASPALRA